MRKLLVAQLLVLFLIACVHSIALERFLYWHWWWLDIFMHAGGGVWAALISAWVLIRVGIQPHIVFILALALGVGASWEVFEYVNGIAAPPSLYVVDTIGDMLAVLMGAIAAHLSIRTFFHRG
jgi:hypothetical protein